MKNTQVNFYKRAQSSAEDSYDYDYFSEEIFEASGPRFKIIDSKSDSNFEQGYTDAWDARTETHHTPLVNSGTEHIDVSLSATGIINCPSKWLKNQSTKELENKLNKELGAAREIYTEEPYQKSPEGLWEIIGSYLNDFNSLHQPSIESSYCNISINSIDPVSENKANVTLSVTAEVFAEGDMIEDDNYDEDRDH